MKGPYERVKYDLRRLWECPVCQRRERAPGSVTSRVCRCQTQKADGQSVVMKLVEDGVQRTVPPVILVHEPLPPLPPLVLPPDEPVERPANPEVAAVERVQEALNPSAGSASTLSQGAAKETEGPSSTAAAPTPSISNASAPQAEGQGGEDADARR